MGARLCGACPRGSGRGARRRRLPARRRRGTRLGGDRRRHGVGCDPLPLRHGVAPRHPRRVARRHRRRPADRSRCLRHEGGTRAGDPRDRDRPRTGAAASGDPARAQRRRGDRIARFASAHRVVGHWLRRRAGVRGERPRRAQDGAQGCGDLPRHDPRRRGTRGSRPRARRQRHRRDGAGRARPARPRRPRRRNQRQRRHDRRRVAVQRHRRSRRGPRRRARDRRGGERADRRSARRPRTAPHGGEVGDLRRVEPAGHGAQRGDGRSVPHRGGGVGGAGMGRRGDLGRRSQRRQFRGRPRTAGARRPRRSRRRRARPARMDLDRRHGAAHGPRGRHPRTPGWRDTA